MERRKFIATLGISTPCLGAVLSSNTSFADASLTSHGIANPNPLIGAAFVAVLEKLLPVAQNITNKLFGSGAKDNATVKKSDATASLNTLADQLKTQAQSVNDDVKYLTAWRNTTGAFVGSVSIKDSLIKIRVLLDSGAQVSDTSLADVKKLVTSNVGQAAAAIQKVWQSKSVDDLPNDDIGAVQGAVSLLVRNLSDVAEKLNGLSEKAAAPTIRNTFSQLSNTVLSAINACETITAQNDAYLIRLSADFLAYMQKFSATPDAQVSSKAKQKAPSGENLTPVAPDKVRSVLQKLDFNA